MSSAWLLGDRARQVGKGVGGGRQGGEGERRGFFPFPPFICFFSHLATTRKFCVLNLNLWIGEIEWCRAQTHHHAHAQRTETSCGDDFKHQRRKVKESKIEFFFCFAVCDTFLIASPPPHPSPSSPHLETNFRETKTEKNQQTKNKKKLNK